MFIYLKFDVNDNDESIMHVNKTYIPQKCEMWHKADAEDEKKESEKPFNWKIPCVCDWLPEKNDFSEAYYSFLLFFALSCYLPIDSLSRARS